jgi:hypothetical protein
MYWLGTGDRAASVTEDPMTTMPVAAATTVDNLRNDDPMRPPTDLARCAMWGDTVPASYFVVQGQN